MNDQALSDLPSYNDNQQGYSLAVAPQDDEFAVITGALRVRLLESVSGRYVWHAIAPEVEDATSVHYSSDGAALAIARRNGSVALYDKASQRVWDVYDGHRAAGLVALWRPGKQHWYVALASRDGDILVWNTVHHGCLFRQQLAGVRAIAWSPDGERLAALGAGRLTCWNVQTRDEQSLDVPAQAADIAWSPGGTHLCFAGKGACVSIDLRTEAWTYYRQSIDVLAYRLAYSVDGTYLVALSYQSLSVWDVETTERVAHVLLGFSPQTILWSHGWKLVMDNGRGDVCASSLSTLVIDSYRVKPFACIDEER